MAAVADPKTNGSSDQEQYQSLDRFVGAAAAFQTRIFGSFWNPQSLKP
jgi:hypothetical protein